MNIIGACSKVPPARERGKIRDMCKIEEQAIKYFISIKRTIITDRNREPKRTTEKKEEYIL